MVVTETRKEKERENVVITKAVTISVTDVVMTNVITRKDSLRILSTRRIIRRNSSLSRRKRKRTLLRQSS